MNRTSFTTAHRVIFLIVFSVFISCSTSQKKWVALGDSITYLNDHQDETGGRVTRGYMTLVVEKLPHINYINKGYNGWTAGDVAREIKNLQLPVADIYTVFLGTNDWWRGRPLGTIADYKNDSGNETFFGSYRIIIDWIRSLNCESKIILITPMKRMDFVYIANMKNNAWGSYKLKNEQSLEQFANAIADIGKLEGIPVVDLYHDSEMGYGDLVKFKWLRDPSTGEYKKFKYPDFTEIPFNPDADEYPYPEEAIGYTYDGLHPSDEGYRVIADMLMKKME